jgi:hypothetical protein
MNYQHQQLNEKDLLHLPSRVRHRVHPQGDLQEEMSHQAQIATFPQAGEDKGVGENEIANR